MKLTEIKTKEYHYFLDEQDRLQGEFKSWWSNGQLWEICHFRDGMHHGEYKRWKLSGKLGQHTFEIGDEEIVNFLENPELYPETDEAKTMFALKYGSGPFIGDANEVN